MSDLMKGYPSFVVSIAMIGVCTAVIGDIAGHLGCFIYLKDSVNAIAFVALGTSVPGWFWALTIYWKSFLIVRLINNCQILSVLIILSISHYLIITTKYTYIHTIILVYIYGRSVLVHVL